jgi:two-component system phosphate regulon sensor histidine kinase PhoR
MRAGIGYKVGQQMLFRRLFLSFLVAIVVATVAAAFAGAAQMREAEAAATREALRREVRILELLLGDDLRAGNADALAARLKALGDGRVTAIAKDGRVLADGSGNPAALDNQIQRPEIVDAAATGEGAAVRDSTGLGEPTLYVARRVGDAGFLRLAAPLAGPAPRAPYLGLASAGALALVVAAGLSYAVVRRITEPLSDLTALAGSLATGDLSRRSGLREPGELGVLTRALNQMADALAAMLAQAAKDRESLRAMMTSMAEGVIAVDRAHRVLFANQNAARLLDIDAAAITGRPIWESVRDERVLKALEQCDSSGAAATVQIGPIRGRTLDISLAASPEGVVLVAHDITETVRYQELRKEFVANVSHELRTPLTMIKGFVETLQDGAAGDPEKNAEYLGIIEKHVNQLTNLVNDLLELSRLESRPGLPRRLEVNVDDLIRRVVELNAPAAAKKNQALKFEPAPGVPSIFGDPDYLERAVANLVQNAIKYTPEGGWIRVSTDERAGFVDITVADNGIGIPADDIPRIFERFYRVDKSRSRDAGGTGLGLSIVKHVVQVHGGSIEVKSELGKGSAFRVSLPVRG